MADFQSTLANIPGLGGYLAQNQMNQQQSMGNLAQMSGSMGILAKLQQQQQQQQAMAKEQEFRGALSALGPNPTQESLATVAARYSPAKDILTSQTASLDRKEVAAGRAETAQANRDAMMERATMQVQANLEAARQRGVDAENLRRMEIASREHLTRLAAQLRPAPAERNLQLTADAQGNQLIVNPDGTTRPLTAPGGGGVRKAVGTDKPLTEFQGKSTLYGTRAAQSDKIMKDLEDKISLPGMATARALGSVGNYAMSSEQRRVDQAQRDFVNAILRQESGAVISDTEFANAQKQYFPQMGDDAKTISQKRANRKMAITGFARMAGQGGKDINDVMNAPLMPSANNPNAVLDAADAILRGGK